MKGRIVFGAVQATGSSGAAHRLGSVERRRMAVLPDSGAGFGMTLVLLFVATLLAATPLPAQPAEDGRTLYVAYGCYQCHGYEGQGGVAGPRIGPSPYPFVAFAQLVRRPANVMPAYAPGVLDDAMLERIYDYVRARPEPPDGDEISLLR